MLGPQHEDTDFIAADYQHYHVDFRFLNDASREMLRGPMGPSRAFSAVITSVNIVAGRVGPADHGSERGEDGRGRFVVPGAAGEV